MTAAPRYVAGWHPNDGWRVGTVEPCCDFCAAPLHGTWTRFGCGDFSRCAPLPGDHRRELVVNYREQWAACRRCAPLVRARQWRALTSRVIRVRRAAGEPERTDTPSELAGLFLTLERYLTGTETQA